MPGLVTVAKIESFAKDTLFSVCRSLERKKNASPLLERMLALFRQEIEKYISKSICYKKKVVLMVIGATFSV